MSTGTLVVLVLMLTVRLVAFLVALAASFFLAKRNGQDVESVRRSLRHGYTATFFESKKQQSGHNPTE